MRLPFKIIRRGYDSLEFMGGGAGSFLSYVLSVKSYDLNVRFSVCYNIIDWLLLVTGRPKQSVMTI